MLTQGLQPTSSDDSDDDAEENVGDVHEESLTLWSRAPLKLLATKVSLFKGEAAGQKPNVHCAIDGGFVTVVSSSAHFTADGTIRCTRGTIGTTTIEELSLMRQQGSEDDDDDDDEETISVTYTSAAGKREIKVHTPAISAMNRRSRVLPLSDPPSQLSGDVKVLVKGDMNVAFDSAATTLQLAVAELRVYEACSATRRSIQLTILFLTFLFLSQASEDEVYESSEDEEKDAFMEEERIRKRLRMVSLALVDSGATRQHMMAVPSSAGMARKGASVP